MTKAEDRVKKALEKILEERDRIVNKKLVRILLSFLEDKGLLDEFDEYFKEYLRR